MNTKSDQSWLIEVRQMLLGIAGSRYVPSCSSGKHHRTAEAIMALKRLDSGHYGKCVDCDKKIPKKRLSVKPEAIRCIKCQSMHDHSNAA